MLFQSKKSLVPTTRQIARFMTMFVVGATFFTSLNLQALSEERNGYTAEDIILHFQRANELGAARGICVGTAQECGIGDRQSAPKAFDLMVTFNINSDRLTEKAKANLTEFGKALRDPRLAIARFAVNGHTDASGSEIYNLRLSTRRAQSVVKFLKSQGIDTSKLIAQGFGEFIPRKSDPFAPENRRVETQIILR